MAAVQYGAGSLHGRARIGKVDDLTMRAAVVAVVAVAAAVLSGVVLAAAAEQIEAPAKRQSYPSVPVGLIERACFIRYGAFGDAFDFAE